jgi:23S rRNA (guanosine2251-2'-O)-methyltransferase
MKHTGKPPKNSSNRTPIRAKSASKGKAGGPKTAPKSGSGPKGAPRGEERTGRHTAQREARKDTRPAKAGTKAGVKSGAKGQGRGEESRSEFRPKDQTKPRSGARTEAPRGTSRGEPRAERGSFDKKPHQGKSPDYKPREVRFEKPRGDKPIREPRAPREPRQSLGPRANMFGLHAVREAWLNPKRYIHALYLSESTEATFAPVLELAISRGLERPEPRVIAKDDFERLLGRDAVHQGIALSAAPLEETFIQDILSIGANKERSVILILDQVTDPHNVGAILRSACAFGADGVVMQRRHAPEIEGVLAKTASGAADHIPVAYETNLSRTLETLKEAGYVAIGLDEHADQTLAEIDIPQKSVLVLGAEGDGMRRLIREHCDALITLPTKKPINSLNVSNAAAVALYALLN